MASSHRAGTVSIATLAALTLMLGVMQAAAPGWAKSLGLDVWNLPGLHGDISANEERSAELDAERARILREMELSEHIAVRLIEGRFTLAQATAELEPILSERSGFDSTWQVTYRTPTFRHGVARYAIQHAELAISHDPIRWAKVSARLEAEYAAMK